MKTHKKLFEKVCSFENLCIAYRKARKGCSNSDDAVSFGYALETELFKLRKKLLNRTYKTGKYRNFVIYEPKKRMISSLPFRDRVVHHAICNMIEPIFDKLFIYDSYACRKGKGTHRGVGKLQSFIRKNTCSYALKCDVSKYFPSINHFVLKGILRKKIGDKKLLMLIDSIIDSAKNGVPIGNLTSQLFANIYLNELDYYAKHNLKAKYYLRYMDDFIILDEKKKLHSMKLKIALFLKSLKLKLHPKKANIFPVACGIEFLGYRIFNDYRLARKSTVKRFLRGIKVKIMNHSLGKITFDKLMESFNSWDAYLMHANTYLLRISLYERYFKDVM